MVPRVSVIFKHNAATLTTKHVFYVVR